MKSPNPTGGPPPNSRRTFLATSMGLATLPWWFEPSGAAAVNDRGVSIPDAVGPVLGHIDESRIFCFVRPPQAGPVKLIVKDAAGKVVAEQKEMADAADDLCTHFRITDLKPGTAYSGEFLGADGRELFSNCRFEAVTAKANGAAAAITLGLGSCVSSTSFDDLWKQVSKQQVDGFCLLGDTPYIDSNDLTRNREARRVFWGHLPSFAALSKRIPFWNTWDDHDFGRNDSDGLMPMKENIRKAFTEYNAISSYGEDGQGIYNHFRRGPVEVWLIDDRWFSQTGPSWADTSQRTCIGAMQWEWLKRTLKASTAPFKILCTGMTWYPKGNKEKDHWETYSAEREAIYSFIKSERIPGVILVSGDIHVSRHHDYGSDRIGYPLHECVVSPMHASVIPSLDIAHPARIWSKPEPNVFVVVKADHQTLKADWINMSGERLHGFELKASTLQQAT
jgi:alkaline phosphatase D